MWTSYPYDNLTKTMQEVLVQVGISAQKFEEYLQSLASSINAYETIKGNDSIDIEINENKEKGRDRIEFD